MGMSIDKAIKLMIQGSKYDYDGTPEEFCEAYDMSIEIMRKYQQIVQIVSLNDEEFKQCGLRELKEILEVIADGNDN